MKLTLLVVGKTDKIYIKQAIEEYTKRLKHYVSFEIQIIADIKNAKNLTTSQQKTMEGKLILSKDYSGKEIHLFDEGGKMFSSREFARFIEKKMVSGLKEVVFVIGGPYGFSNEVYKQANSKISLSRLTFSHQMARLLCVEQIYRAFTIIKGEPYHHD
ncbi:23S rRNA (pseudouridine(1915)-N(3))-methyltransferase RlmH [Maribellus comscasis]|uniref:Ribosomal RNA large subunit methyltransferase H n=1 Tax=Maribellus comscasis TaxID=2681766 RepID=A0A6I6JRL3_9BACT|nr:23S rRNA (pseudouridine(1915)-N(3))-methyltransferase RlmH [Maribellus comscasis]QGY43700.1 23S rRNA (pseudouridine(1915)-N(3))-methyltransferase RlmH [Maribellus comscasis]